jgi:hypothetical protein
MMRAELVPMIHGHRVVLHDTGNHIVSVQASALTRPEMQQRVSAPAQSCNTCSCRLALSSLLWTQVFHSISTATGRAEKGRKRGDKLATSGLRRRCRQAAVAMLVAWAGCVQIYHSSGSVARHASEPTAGGGGGAE